GRGVLWRTRRGSRWDAEPPRPHPANRRPLAAADAAARPDPLAAHPAAAGPATMVREVEAPALQQPLRRPPPSGVFYPPCLFGRLALETPGGPLADVAGPMQMHPYRLDARLQPGHLFQVGSQQTGGPHGTRPTDAARLLVDHPLQFGHPGGCDLQRPPRRFARSQPSHDLALKPMQDLALLIDSA